MTPRAPSPAVHPEGSLLLTAASETLDVSRLRQEQINGWHCALCDGRLYADRSIGVHDVPYGSKTVPTELWACAPDCGTTKPPTGRRV